MIYACSVYALTGIGNVRNRVFNKQIILSDSFQNPAQNQFRISKSVLGLELLEIDTTNAYISVRTYQAIPAEVRLRSSTCHTLNQQTTVLHCKNWTKCKLGSPVSRTSNADELAHRTATKPRKKTCWQIILILRIFYTIRHNHLWGVYLPAISQVCMHLQYPEPGFALYSIPQRYFPPHPAVRMQFGALSARYFAAHPDTTLRRGALPRRPA